MKNSPILSIRLHNIIGQLIAMKVEFSSDTVHEIYQQRYEKEIPNEQANQIGAAFRTYRGKLQTVRTEQSKRPSRHSSKITVYIGGT